ncbi:hypothetical protein MKY41_07995 [Sporosarcina sp. FSL W7-1349]|uniref:hypothetical protein n=1 Tax=Sporosarcina sp. FSL W7-1349 TaxID=2921561 RepID=UPI0030F7CC85
MEKKVNMTEIDIIRSHLSFVLPLNYTLSQSKHFSETLQNNGYTYFNILEASKLNEMYGEGIAVSGKEFEQYFLPFIERKLFPPSLHEQGFHRFSKSIQKDFRFRINRRLQRFKVRSIDIILGPFGIAFLTLRIELNETTSLSDVLDFTHHFRAVEPKVREERGAKVLLSNDEPISVHRFLFDQLCPFLQNLIPHDEKLQGYYGSLPYFDDERMYTSGFLFAREHENITQDQLFRMGQVNGRTPTGEPFLSATNPKYIQQMLQDSLHDRWAPHTYTVTTDHAFMKITNHRSDEMRQELSQFMGTHYYNLLLHYFYKIMLLRFVFEYSSIDWDKDDEYVKSLIKSITLFSSWYYSEEISTRTEGKEVSSMFRKAFNISNLFTEVTNTLNELYRNQENSNAGRMNILLFVLTVFTVISGIYGMNLVIDDWDDPFKWSKVTSYTFFEWISLITAISGIGLSAYLIFHTFLKMGRRKWRSKKNDLSI